VIRPPRNCKIEETKKLESWHCSDDGVSHEPTIREACPADVLAIMELERQSAMAAHWREADYVRIFTEGSPSRLALVAEEDEALLGFLVASHVGPEWEIENVAVAAQVTRRGLGSRLIREFLTLAEERGVESVFLEVRESNRAARALYETLKFVETGRRKNYYSGPLEDAVVYRKAL
jgi:[ribosomal protein S18]-alanine N-acetyltransferase